MRDDTNFALVMRMEAGGKTRFPFDYGVCVVEGDSARTSFTDLAGVSQIIGSTPCVPSIYGARPGIVSFEAEAEAIDMLSQATREFGTKYSYGRPDGYEPLRTLIKGGVVATVSEGRISVDIADWAAAGAGWHIGDRVELSAKTAGNSFSLHADRDGFPLVEGDRTDWLGLSRDWPLPPGLDIPDGHYQLAFSSGPEGIFMAFPETDGPRGDASVALPEAAKLANPRVSPLSPNLPFDYRWALVSLAAIYGLLTLSLKFI
jgi:hypothetical protein|nr:hypothetical protein [Neorhizobium tomejilense]